MLFHGMKVFNRSPQAVFRGSLSKPSLCLREDHAPAADWAAYLVGTQVRGSGWVPAVHGYLRWGSGWVSQICLWSEEPRPAPSFCRWETEAQRYGTSSGEVGGIARAADSNHQPLRGLRTEARRGRPGQCVGVRRC